MNGITGATLNDIWSELRKAPGAGYPPELLKAINQATGLVWYDLEPYAKLLFPVITPLRNEIPRVAADGGTATNWKSITAINTNKVSIALAEGQRGGSVTTTVVDNVATYKSWGLDDSVTFQADWASKNFDDVKQLAVDNLLRNVMIGEEKMIVGGNASVLLGTTPTPSGTASNTGGALADATYKVVCVALAYDAFDYVGGVNTLPGNAILVPASVTRTNTDGTTITYGGGSAQKSAESANLTVNGGTSLGSITASVTAVRGAVGYAWFLGTTGATKLAAITSINSVSLTTAPDAGNQTAASLPASDNSENTYLTDGLISQVAKSGSGGYYNSLATGVAGTGTKLTSNGAGGVTEIETMLKSFWDVSRLGPTALLVNSQELKSVSDIAIAGGSAPLFRFVADVAGKDSAEGMGLTAGTVVGNYLNKYTMSGGQLIKVLLHPNVPPGTIIAYSKTIPYPLSNVRNLLQFKMRRDYYQIEWPTTKPAYEYAVLADGVLQNYFVPAFGIINNIAA
jgi:hypothetical protein